MASASPWTTGRRWRRLTRHDLYKARRPRNASTSVRARWPLESAHRRLLLAEKGQRIGTSAAVGGEKHLAGVDVPAHSPTSACGAVGERNREVRAFVDHDLARKGCAVGGPAFGVFGPGPAPLRLRARFRVAGHCRVLPDQGGRAAGMDSRHSDWPWRNARSGLAAGEPPARRATRLRSSACCPRIFERAGSSAAARSTGFFTVLVEGDDITEPIADAVRAILDGHIVLSRASSPTRDTYAGHRHLELGEPSDSEVAAGSSARRCGSASAEHLSAVGGPHPVVGAYVSGANPQLGRGPFACGADAQLPTAGGRGEVASGGDRDGGCRR